MVPQGGREGVGAGERASGRVARVHRRAIEEEEMGVGGARPSLYICTLSKPRVLVMRNGAAWPLPSLLHWHCPPPRSISSRREGAPEAESSCARGRRQREAPPSHVWAKGKEGGLTLASGREIWQHRPSPRVVLPKGPRNQMPFLSPGLPRPNRPALVASFTAPQRPYASTVAAYLRALAIPFGVCPAPASMPRLLILLIL